MIMNDGVVSCVFFTALAFASKVFCRNAKNLPSKKLVAVVWL